MKMIPYVTEEDLPCDILDWCVENGIYVHYNNNIAQVIDDGNPLAEWLKSNGVVFESLYTCCKPTATVAISGI